MPATVNQKKLIIKAIIDIAEKRQKINKRVPLIFTVNDIYERIPYVYKASIGRELRALKKIGFLDYQLVGERIDGKYKLSFDGRQGKRDVLAYLEKCMAILDQSRKPTLSEMVDDILRIKRS